MKRTLFSALMVGLLASCNTAVTSDGSSVKVLDEKLRTEYRLASGEYVACNDVDKNHFLGLFKTDWNKKTQVSVPFTVSGNVASVEIELVGSRSKQNNGFITTVTGEDLKKMSVSAGNTNEFRALFDADVDQGRILPTGIEVKPIVVSNEPRFIKQVQATEPLGSFFVNIKLTNNSGTAESNPLRVGGTSKEIKVYRSCLIEKATTEKL